LSLPNGFVMLDGNTALDSTDNYCFFVVQVQRNQRQDGFSDYFFSRVAENLLRPFVPARNYSLQIFADNSVVRRFDDGSEMRRRFFYCLALGNVAGDGDK